MQRMDHSLPDCSCLTSWVRWCPFSLCFFKLNYPKSFRTSVFYKLIILILPHSIPLVHDSPEPNDQNRIRDFSWSPRAEQHGREDLIAHLAGETPAYTSQDMVCLFHSTVTLLICMAPSHLTPKLWPCWLIQPLCRTWHFSLQNSPFFKHFWCVLSVWSIPIQPLAA